MKQVTTFLLLLSIVGSATCTAQNSFGDIENRSSLFGPVFSQKGQPLKMRDLKRVTQDNPEAYRFMEQASTNNDFSNIFGFIGGALVGWPLGTAIGGGDPNWTLAAAGAGLIAISIPFAVGYKRNAIEGARIYNENRGLPESSAVQLSIRAGANGLGLALNF